MLDPVPGCIAAPKDDTNLFEWSSTIQGPENSPYAGGTFLLDINFAEDYPFKAPKVRLWFPSTFLGAAWLFSFADLLISSGSIQNSYLPLQYQPKRRDLR